MSEDVWEPAAEVRLRANAAIDNMVREVALYGQSLCTVTYDELVDLCIRSEQALAIDSEARMSLSLDDAEILKDSKRYVVSPQNPI